MQVARRIEELKSRQLVIELPESFVDRKVEVIILTIDEGEAPRQPHKRRKPPPQFAGKVKELGDVMSSVPSSDWGIIE